MFLREGLFLFLYANAEAQQSAKPSRAAKRIRVRRSGRDGGRKTREARFFSPLTYVHREV